MKFYISLLLTIASVSVFAQSEQERKQRMHDRDRDLSDNSQVRASNMRSDTFDIIDYNISLEITDFVTKVIRGNTVVKFSPDIAGVTRLNLDLLMMTIDSVEINGDNLSYSYNDTLLEIDLPMAYNVNDTLSVKISYHGVPQGDPSGWGGFYFQSGYAYNLGVGFGALPHTYGRVWFPCFDNFVERSTYEFNISTNGGKIAFCNGYLASDTTNAGGLRTRRWIMEETIPTYLASVTVAAYAQVNQTYNGMNGSIPIILAAVPTDTTAVKNSFVNLPVALSAFENRFGPYMWNRVGYCMVPFNSGAMEHATNISYPKATATGNLTYQNLYAHELAHHWFGDLATCRTAEDMWLNEGWAHYCEFIFSEALGNYSNYLTGVRNNHQDVLQFAHNKEGGYLTLSNIPQTHTYGDHVYNKGADIAHCLRGYMGDSLFFHSVKTYLAQNNYKDVSSDDFKNALTAASGMDMSDFFNDWVHNPGFPHFSIDSVQSTAIGGGNYSVTVFVKQKLTGAPNYYTNVPLEMTFKAADWTQVTQPFTMSGPNAPFSFTVPFDPAFTAVNMGEKISHAVAPDFKTVKQTGTIAFANAKFTLNVLGIADSAFVRVEHNYTKPDSFKDNTMPYRLSPNRYWKVDGLFPAGFYSKATISYDGRTTAFSSNYWLDNLLNIVNEDSLCLMYRRDAADDWHVYPYYTKNMAPSVTDKRGTITIDSLKRGEYVLAIGDLLTGVKEKEILMPGIGVFPNPADNSLTLDLNHIREELKYASIVVTDVRGKVIHSEKIPDHSQSVKINTASFSNGVYFVSVEAEGEKIATGKFVVSH
ncbi:MAG TPA: M1 family aminopeptidase [Bacteroidia bacterium]|jgi:aminopeptidase N